jgi:predicted nuclease with TOPRIM domain
MQISEEIEKRFRRINDKLARLEEKVKDIDDDLSEICDDIYCNDELCAECLLKEDISFNDFIKKVKGLGYHKIKIDISDDGTCEMLIEE